METRKYELSFWLSSSLNETEAETKFNEIIKKIESRGGQILSTQIPSLRIISYPIKKETNGYFSFIQFSGEDLKLDDWKKEFKLDNNILRFALIKSPETKQKVVVRRPKRVVATKKSVTPLKEKTAEMSIEELDEKLNEILKE
ncbi:MAG: 30S ribosomal protein S6 [Parcubacteria group bacterium]|nr:30S ribosomal protein S6 [Parcubacteria group bacterium]